MKELAKEFVRSEFHHKQIFRDGDVAIYERWKPGQSAKHYEVIKIRIEKEREVFGKLVPEHEAYPPSGDWGSLGWTTNDLERAKVMAENLLIARKAASSSCPEAGKGEHVEGDVGANSAILGRY